VTVREETAALLIEVNRSRSAAAGVDPNQYAQVTGELTSLSRWPAAFTETADGHLDLARRAEGEGRTVSAAQAYRDASLWFHYAACVPDADSAAVRDAEDRAAAALRAALALDDPGLEHAARIDALGAEIPFVALIQRPAGTGHPPPVVIVIPGLDSSKEEFQAVAAELRRRGMATVSIDGPGQGEAAGVAPLPEYERVVAAVFDHLTEVPGLNLSRVGAIGLSLGGYYVARAAAREPRLRAVVAVTGPYSLDWDALPPPLQATLAVRAGGRDAAAAIAARIELAGVAGTIGQPLLAVCGEKDPVVSPAGMRRLAAEAPAGELLPVAVGDHLCANATWQWRPYAADWLAARLGAYR
jgi:alpha-beta hydrolase superfamily lysophospholipase